MQYYLHALNSSEAAKPVKLISDHLEAVIKTSVLLL
jgi:hypothetical protein